MLQRGVKRVPLWESTSARLVDGSDLFVSDQRRVYQKLHPVSTICIRDNGTPFGCSLVALSTSSEEPKTPGPEIWFKTWKKTTGSCEKPQGDPCSTATKELGSRTVAVSPPPITSVVSQTQRHETLKKTCEKPYADLQISPVYKPKSKTTSCNTPLSHSWVIDQPCSI